MSPLMRDTSQPVLRRSRTAALLAFSAAGVLLLGGCAAGAPTDDSDDSGSQEFSFSYETSDTSASPYEAIAEKYMEEHPDVTITLNPVPNDQYDQTVRTQLQAGNASDVLSTVPGSGQGRGIVALSEAGFLEPLGESAAALVPVGSEALFGADGEVYGQAMSITFVGLIENATAAESEGIEWPTDWDGVEEACTAMSEKGKSFLALAGAQPPNTGLMGMVLAATRVYAEDPDWNQKRTDGDVTFAGDAGWEATLQTVIDLNEAGCFQAGVEGGGFDAVSGNVPVGNALAGFLPAGQVKNLQAAAADVEFAIQAFPPATSSDDEFGYASANYTLSVNAASKNKDAANEFLEWLTEPENAGLFAEVDGSLPISGLEDLDLSDTPYASVADLLTSGAYAPLPNATWPNSSVNDALAVGIQGLLTGQKTIDQVLDDMDAAWG